MYIGFDIGGTNVRYALSSNLAAPINRSFRKSFSKTGEPCSEVEKNICQVIEQYGEIEGIAISLAANIDRSTGIVRTWSNNPCWNNYHFIGHLKEKFKVPIVVEDDANCGAMGEFYGLSCSSKNMVYISVGTGIGCGIIINGELFVGDNGMAGELGHITIMQKEEMLLCGCGQVGCLQSLISGKALLKQYNSNSNKCIETVKEVTDRALAGDTNAQDLLYLFKKKLIDVIYNLSMIFDISTFVIGGGVGTINYDVFSEIEEVVNDRLKRFKKSLRLYGSKFGEFSGIQGAFYLLSRYMEKVTDENYCSN